MISWGKRDKANPNDIAITTIVVGLLVQFKMHDGAWFHTLGRDGQQQLGLDIIVSFKQRLDAEGALENRETVNRGNNRSRRD